MTLTFDMEWYESLDPRHRAAVVEWCETEGLTLQENRAVIAASLLDESGCNLILECVDLEGPIVDGEVPTFTVPFEATSPLPIASPV